MTRRSIRDLLVDGFIASICGLAAIERHAGELAARIHARRGES